MLIVIDPHSGVPVFRQIMDQVRFHITSGLAQPGDALPSTRALSSELGINQMTVSKAYNQLEQSGIVIRQRGRPLTVAAAESESIAEERKKQLERALAPGITAARQLGLTDDQAMEIFRQLLAPKTGDES